MWIRQLILEWILPYKLPTHILYAIPPPQVKYGLNEVKATLFENCIEI